MHLVYVDEVKYDPPTQPYHWVCAVGIPETKVKDVEEALDQIAIDYFGASVLDPSTEFHARDIFHGKGPFSGKLLAERVELLKELASVISDHGLERIQIRVDPSRMSRDDYAKVGFMYLVERVDQLMVSRESLALIICDHDKQFVNENVRNLSTYKASGTDFEFGQEIDNVVDTVHHTQSHHSRLLQLADVYVYLCAMLENEGAGYPREEIIRHLRSLPNFVWPSKYKHWPPAGGWGTD